MAELFQPSYKRLTTAPLALTPELARLCIQRLSDLVQSKPAELTDSDYEAIRTAFVAGYSAFAAGTDDYSSLNLPELRQLCNKAFVYTKDMLVAMLRGVETVKYTKVFGSLANGSVLYDAGLEDSEQMVSLDQSTVVTLSSVLAMSN